MGKYLEIIEIIQEKIECVNDSERKKGQKAKIGIDLKKYRIDSNSFAKEISCKVKEYNKSISSEDTLQNISKKLASLYVDITEMNTWK